MFHKSDPHAGRAECLRLCRYAHRRTQRYQLGMSRQAECVKSWLALEAWRWSPQRGSDTITASVASCFANRVKKGWGTWQDVLSNIPLYAAVNIDEIPGGYPNPSDPVFIRLLVLVDKIFNNEFDDKRNGANDAVLFCDLAHITRPWFLENIVHKPTEHPRVITSNTFACFK